MLILNFKDSQDIRLRAQADVERAYPIADLYFELVKCIGLIPLEDGHHETLRRDQSGNISPVTKQELITLVDKTKSTNTRYDKFLELYVFVGKHLDNIIMSKSDLLAKWRYDYDKIITFYSYGKV